MNGVSVYMEDPVTYLPKTFKQFVAMTIMKLLYAQLYVVFMKENIEADYDGDILRQGDAVLPMGANTPVLADKKRTITVNRQAVRDLIESDSAKHAKAFDKLMRSVASRVYPEIRNELRRNKASFFVSKVIWDKEMPELVYGYR